jgi:sugar (pentulose or hexulose) kinase
MPDEGLPAGGLQTSGFAHRDLSSFTSFEEAYHQLLTDIIRLQVKSTLLVLKGTNMKRIFVDGGFSSNAVYMNLLAAAFPQLEVYGASVPQASALGAALAIHKHWNPRPIPTNLVDLKRYASTFNSMP